MAIFGVLGVNWSDRGHFVAGTSWQWMRSSVCTPSWRLGWPCTLTPKALCSCRRLFKCGSTMVTIKALRTSCFRRTPRALQWPSFFSPEPHWFMGNTNARKQARTARKPECPSLSDSGPFSSSPFRPSWLDYAWLAGIYFDTMKVMQVCRYRFLKINLVWIRSQSWFAPSEVLSSSSGN